MKLAEIRKKREELQMYRYSVAWVAGTSANTVRRLEAGLRVSKRQANKILEALGFTETADDIEDVVKDVYCVGESDRKTGADAEKDKKLMRPHNFRDTLAMDEREAREWGLSYGVYKEYERTGYLDTWKEQYINLKARDAASNVIESHIGGSSAGRFKSSSAGKI